MRYEYKTENTCFQLISFDINDDIVTGNQGSSYSEYVKRHEKGVIV